MHRIPRACLLILFKEFAGCRGELVIPWPTRISSSSNFVLPSQASFELVNLSSVCAREWQFILYFIPSPSLIALLWFFYPLSCKKLLHVIMLWPIKCRPKYSSHSLLNCPSREQSLALCSLLFPSSYSGPGTRRCRMELQPPSRIPKTRWLQRAKA